MVEDGVHYYARVGAKLTKVQGAFDEAAVVDAFAREGLAAHRWSNGAGDVYASHAHAYHKVLFCLRGSIVFRMTPAGVGATGEEIALAPGDRLDIEPGTEHGAVVGPRGVECVEAARP
jgi:quercetin dioxygenase-like cupin family protein